MQVYMNTFLKDFGFKIAFSINQCAAVYMAYIHTLSSFSSLSPVDASVSSDICN